jgi:hypothetical protein
VTDEMTEIAADGRPMDEARSEESPEEIRADIEETREEMGGTLDALGDRLDPNRLMSDAKENVREATIGRVEDAVEAAGETAKGVTDMVMETITRNPIPAAMVGVGAFMLWRSRSEGSAKGPQRPGVGDHVTRVAADVASTAGEAATQAAEQGRATVEQVGSQFDRMLQASPLAVGAVAVGAGALVGALLPETAQEREMLGDASHQVASTVRDTVSQTAEMVKEQADRAEEAVATPS